MAGVTASPIVRILNEEVRHYHRWCTPSTLVDQERIEDFYASDVSISAGFFGTLVDHTGVFGEAERFAAAAQGADRTMFSVHGSSGSNWIVLRMLALERSDALVLVARNIHHSIINALKAFGLNFRFLPTPYDAEFEAVLPPSVEQVLTGLRRYPEAIAVVYTSPTYEGLCANTREIADAVHAASPETILFVDEAWGGHLHFHPELPSSAMDSGADVSVQSTHKLAGGLQQTGLIHWREQRVDTELMEEAFREYVTTSPSYHLLASADAAVRSLAANGEAALGACIERTRELKAALRERLPRLVHLDEPSEAADARFGAEHVAAVDLVKTTVALTRYDIAGFAVAQALVEHGIVVEKAGINTLTFITTFQLDPGAVADTVRALEAVLAGHELANGKPRRLASNPFSAFDDRLVEVYPPGIPVILEGFRVSADAVRYLCEVRDMGGAIVARDTSLQTLRVL
jgi:arginine decarboxylase